MKTTKKKTVTRAEVRSWPSEALTSARYFGDVAEDDTDDGAWQWINGAEHCKPEIMGYVDGDDPCRVMVLSDTRTNGKWVEVTP